MVFKGLQFISLDSWKSSKTTKRIPKVIERERTQLTTWFVDCERYYGVIRFCRVIKACTHGTDLRGTGNYYWRYLLRKETIFIINITQLSINNLSVTKFTLSSTTHHSLYLDFADSGACRPGRCRCFLCQGAVELVYPAWIQVLVVIGWLVGNYGN